MKRIITIMKKEIFEHINSGQLYIASIAFLIITGAFFAEYLFLINRSDLYNIFSIIPFILMVFVPIITMGSFSSELNSGTIELLLTLPFKDNDILFGKYLGNIVTYSLVLFSTLTYPLTIFILGSPDAGQIFSSYLAALILGISYISVGLFSSSLTKSGVTSFIISFCIIFIFIYLGNISILFPGIIGQFFNQLSILNNYNNLLKGLLDTKTLIYFISFNFLFLYLTRISLERRN